MKFNLFGSKLRTPREKPIPSKSKPEDATKDNTKVAPPGRISSPNDGTDFNNIFYQFKNKKILSPLKYLELVPHIRSAYKVNEDLGSVLFDLVQLTNTGHKISFDQDVNPKLADKMRDHLKARSKEWGYGTAGMEGIINKWIAQIWVGGALSFESAPDRRLTKVESVFMVNPETIRFGRNNKGQYETYQKVNGWKKPGDELIKLNTNTFTYVGLWGDEDLPYGIPPLITALSSLATQADMKTNINHILKQLGLLGYLEVMLDKPDQLANESESKYKDRLNGLLIEAKKNTKAGFLDGVVVGYREDHEFNFNSTTKNLAGVNDVFNLNENQLANGLKSPAAFLGLDQKGGEGQLGIVFTKMLSQLKNVQQILSFGLARLYQLELDLAGYNYNGNIMVEFKTSTISDDLKLWQGREIKQRVLHALWVDRIISSEKYAEEMDQQKPHKVIEPPEPGQTAGADSVKKEEREKKKDESDRRSRDKSNPQPKRKDRSTKTR